VNTDSCSGYCSLDGKDDAHEPIDVSAPLRGLLAAAALQIGSIAC